jgi:hypothetical protein
VAPNYLGNTISNPRRLSFGCTVPNQDLRHNRSAFRIPFQCALLDIAAAGSKVPTEWDGWLSDRNFRQDLIDVYASFVGVSDFS